MKIIIDDGKLRRHILKTWKKIEKNNIKASKKNSSNKGINKKSEINPEFISTFKYDEDPVWHDEKGFMWSDWLYQKYCKLNELENRTPEQDRQIDLMYEASFKGRDELKKVELEIMHSYAICWFKEFDLDTNTSSIQDCLVDKVSYSKEIVISYLQKGKRIASCPRELYDPITKEFMVNYFSAYTDGEYYWLDVLPSLIKKYNIELPKLFIQKIEQLNKE